MRTRSRSSQGEGADGADTVSGVSEQPEAGPSGQEALSSRRATRRTTAQQADAAAQLPAIREEPVSQATPRPRRQSRTSESQVQHEAVKTPAPRKSTGRRRRQPVQDALEEAQQPLEEADEQPSHDDRQQSMAQQFTTDDGPSMAEQEQSDCSDSEAPGMHPEHGQAAAAATAAAAAAPVDSSGATSSRPAPAGIHAAQFAADASAMDSDDEDSSDGDALLERLAASIGAAFGGASAAGPPTQQQHQDGEVAAAAGAAAAASSADRLTWQPDTGLRPLIAPDPAIPSGGTAAAPQLPGAQLPTKERGLAGKLQVPPRDAVRAAREAKKAAPDTAGAKWYGLPATKIDEDMKRDLRLLRLRGAYDPKRFYKSFDKGKFPKYFQVGTVVDDPLDFYGGRLTKAERKTTLTEQLLADTDLSHNRKKRYSKLQVEAQKYTKVKKRKTDLPRNKSPHHRPKH